MTYIEFEKSTAKDIKKMCVAKQVKPFWQNINTTIYL